MDERSPAQVFTPLDHQFARFITMRSGLTGSQAVGFELLIKRLSASLSSGDSCLPVNREEEQRLREIINVCHDITTPLTSSPPPPSPLVLWQGRLYLQRYYRYETRLAVQLQGLARIQDEGVDSAALLDTCFGPDTEQAPDWQRRAADLALKRPLALISGGPGTGKTRTVAQILGLLLLVFGPDLHIALAAPTGKAAMRLRESIAKNLETLTFSPSIKEKIPTGASTLHRLLGVQRYSSGFRHHHGNPLPWDVVVVDEASMVDLAMMSKLVDALKPGARLILLGDKDQLASVESGAVLADCIGALADNTVELKKSYRFNQEIEAFARAVNTSDSSTAWDLLAGGQAADTGTVGAVRLLHEPLPDFICTQYLRYMQKIAVQGQSEYHADDIRQLFQAFNRFRVLCATKRGVQSVEAINRRVERDLAAQGFPCQPGNWYPGRPVMILQNDYTLNLFNGDVGICLPEAATTTADPADLGNLGNQKRFQIWFEREDGSLKGYQPSMLPAHETVFAMTIHKSQGSEFTEVLVVLPSSDSPLLTRELIYTAITRAKERVLIAGDQAIFHAAVQRTISRSSGLQAMLTSLR
jgi:exodeoxyribonuclease V alpha subunit